VVHVGVVEDDDGVLAAEFEDCGLDMRAASVPMIRPTPVDPVKLTTRTRGSAIRASAMSAAS
jgi:hypothetical protein